VIKLEKSSSCWSIVPLNVVPAPDEDWAVPPFEGRLEDGKIYGRGVQDMKSVCIQYIEAIRKLHNLNFQPRRHVYLTFVPDEEVGGAGMAAFLCSSLFKSFTHGIALALDEGLASETNALSVFYGERVPWWIDVEAKGHTGHGSRFIEHTAVEQLLELCNKAMSFRKQQRDLLHGIETRENCSHTIAAKRAKAKKTLGDVTTLNMVPPHSSCTMDIQMSPNVNPSKIRTMFLDEWCRECSTSEGELKWSFLHGNGNIAFLLLAMVNL